MHRYMTKDANIDNYGHSLLIECLLCAFNCIIYLIYSFKHKIEVLDLMQFTAQRTRYSITKQLLFNSVVVSTAMTKYRVL